LGGVFYFGDHHCANPFLRVSLTLPYSVSTLRLFFFSPLLFFYLVPGCAPPFLSPDVHFPALSGFMNHFAAMAGFLRRPSFFFFFEPLELFLFALLLTLCRVLCGLAPLFHDLNLCFRPPFFSPLDFYLRNWFFLLPGVGVRPFLLRL